MSPLSLLRACLFGVLLLTGCLRQDVLPDITPDVVIDPVTPVTPVEPINPSDPLRVLILYEQDELKSLPPSQVTAIQGGAVRDWLDANHAEWRIWDQHTDTTYADPFWKEAIKQPHGKLPWIWVTGRGRRGINGPYSLTQEDALRLLNEQLAPTP